jgi:serine/threonine protein kinase
MKRSSDGFKDSISSGTSEQTVRPAVAVKKAAEEPPKKVSIQDFQLIKVLGKGCMGKVLLVREHKTGRLLALKAISKEWVIMQREIEHTKTERDILANVAAVDHPFLIKLHHSFQSASQLFLVLDYYVGGDIATQLAKWHKFDADRCKLYAAEILLGMQELHRQGIVYRDLKPENILLSSDGHLVLTDFGLSKQFYPTGEEKTTTFCGTAEYLAPEILRAEEYSYEVDYWSLGTLLYEMLTGITPFWAENHADMYRRVLEDELEFPEDFDPVTADFIAGLLERDSQARLGAGPNGEQHIRSHPYFEGMSWDDVYHKRYTPPHVPDLHSETDFSNFDDAFLVMTPRLSPTPGNLMLTNSVQDVFQGYSFTTHPLAGHDADDDDEYDEDAEYEEDEDQQVPHQQSTSELQSRYTQQLDDNDDMEEDYYYSNATSDNRHIGDFADSQQEYDDYEQSEMYEESAQQYSRKRSNLNLEPDSDDSDSEDEFHEQERKRSAKKRHTLDAESQFNYAYDQQLSESLMFSQPSAPRPQSSARNHSTDTLSSTPRQNGARPSNMVSPSIVQMVPDFGTDNDLNLEFPIHQSMYEYPATKNGVEKFAPAPTQNLKHKKSSVLVH